MKDISKYYKDLYGDRYDKDDMDRRYESLIKRHEELFGVKEDDTMLFSTAGRTELAGNHTDHNLGLVIAGTINLDTIAAVSYREDSKVIVNSEGFPEVVVDIDDLEVKEEEKTSEDEDTKPLEHKPLIEYDDFAKLELRIGEIIACEEVPKSKKLLKETIKIGNETRTVLSGIKKWYKPEDMVGKKVMVVVNLAPRKIAGIESQGMVLAAEDESGELLSLMTPDKKEMPSGSEVC